MRVELSEAADLDLVDIYTYTAIKFGQNQADNYLMGIDDMLNALASNPMLGKERNEIVNGLCAIPYEAHIVFYRLMPDRLRVVRVLHASRDFTKHLK